MPLAFQVGAEIQFIIMCIKCRQHRPKPTTAYENYCQQDLQVETLPGYRVLERVAEGAAAKQAPVIQDVFQESWSLMVLKYLVLLLKIEILHHLV